MSPLFFVFWLFLCVIVGLFANQRRYRSGIGWFFVAFFFSPLVAFLIVAVLRESDGTGLTVNVPSGPAWLFGSSESRPWSAGMLGKPRRTSHWDRLKAKE
jgi:hypothetical protein